MKKKINEELVSKKKKKKKKKQECHMQTEGRSLSNHVDSYLKQEAHGPWVAHLSDIATADMQMLCNIFPILSSQLMKRSSFKQFFILKKKIYGMPVN